MIDRDRSALVLVDVQPDFMPGGALAVADGDAIVMPLAKLLAVDRFSLVDPELARVSRSLQRNKFETRTSSDYCALRVSIGSMFAARRAGM